MPSTPFRTFLLTLSIATGMHASAAESEQFVSTKLSDNLYMAGGEVYLNEPVAGDFSAAGGKITVRQRIEGDATLAAGQVSVLSEIGGDLRAAGGEVRIANRVGGNAVCAGGNVEFSSAAEVLGPTRVAGGSVALAGKFHQDIAVYGRDIKVDAELLGDTRLTGERIVIGPGARIVGTLRYSSPNEIQRDPAAQISGLIQRDADPSWRHHSYRQYAWWVLHPVFSFGMFALGVLWLLLFPRFSVDVNETLSGSPGKSIAAGLGVAAVVPWLAVLFFVTVVGIPIGMLLVMSYPLLLMIGYVALMCFVGERALKAMGRTTPSTGKRIALLAVTMLAFAFVRTIPFVGWLVSIAAVLFGTGAVALAAYRHYAKPGGQKPAATDLPPFVTGSAV